MGRREERRKGRRELWRYTCTCRLGTEGGREGGKEEGRRGEGGRKGGN